MTVARSILALVVALSASLTTACGDNREPRSGQSLSVLTWNLYLGSSLGSLLFVQSPDQIPSAVAQVWQEVEASRFPERVELIAREIVARNPDVVGLQEVSLYRMQRPGDWTSGAAPNATEPTLDFLTLLTDRLAVEGGRYRTVTTQTNGDAELPLAAGDGVTADLRLTDRDVILVREDVAAVEQPGGTFMSRLAAPIGGAGGETLRFTRGFVAAEVTVGDRRVRIVNSHLEIGFFGPGQEAQARELVAALLPVEGPLVLLGDFNSAADGSGTASYRLLTTREGNARPFTDAWTAGGGQADAGATCCADPASATDGFEDRIDLVLHRGGVRARTASIVGHEARTTSGLRASDHLGVYAELDL